MKLSTKRKMIATSNVEAKMVTVNNPEAQNARVKKISRRIHNGTTRGVIAEMSISLEQARAMLFDC